MIIKMFEVRDEGTCIVVLAYRMKPANEAQQLLWERCGYGPGADGQAEYVWLQRIDGGEGKGTSDVFQWGNSRTMHEAHKYIKKNFDSMKDGEVVDVQFINGETTVKKDAEIVAARR